MTEFYKPADGERVRVIYEGEARRADSIGVSIVNEHGSIPILWDDAPALVSIEKIEPPVVQYGPGDVVRGKKHGVVRALGEDGYIILSGSKHGLLGRFYGYASGGYALSSFNSETSELVDFS